MRSLGERSWWHQQPRSHPQLSVPGQHRAIAQGRDSVHQVAWGNKEPFARLIRNCTSTACVVAGSARVNAPSRCTRTSWWLSQCSRAGIFPLPAGKSEPGGRKGVCCPAALRLITRPLHESSETKAWKVGCQEKTPGSCATCSAGRVAVRRDGEFGAAEPRHAGTPHTPCTLQVLCCESWRAPSRMHAVGVSAERCFAAAPCPQQPAGWCSGAGRCVQPVPPSLVPRRWCLARGNDCGFVTADCPPLALAFYSFRQAAFT